jgi:hypothetical protein
VSSRVSWRSSSQDQKGKAIVLTTISICPNALSLLHSEILGVWKLTGPRVERRWVGREIGGTYDIITLNTIGLSPCTHHPCVVERNHSYDIHAFGLELGEVLDVAWEMLDGAAGGEGAWDSEEHDFLAGEFCGLSSVSIGLKPWMKPWRGCGVRCCCD